MPTARGWTVTLVGVALCVASRAFGAEALGQIGVALIVLVAAALIVVRMGRHDLRVQHRVVPERVPAETPVTVTLEVTNSGRGSAPLVLVEDEVPAALRTRARFTLSGIEPRGRRDATYSIRPARRGRFEIGPAEISCVDPFALARTRSTSLGTASLLVYPKVEQLMLPRDLGERRTMSISAVRQPTGAQGEDFYTLREYVEGDDLRKIHWPATAKRQRYMIRQEETPWQNRATIVLDDRASGYHSTSFERAVETAASVVDLYHRCGFTYSLVGAHHPGFAAARGAQHRERCMDHLATIGTREVADATDPMLNARFAELAARGSAEGTLVVIAGDLEPDAAVGLGRCRRSFKQVVAVTFPSHRFGSTSTRDRWDGEKRHLEVVRLLANSGIRSLVLGPGDGVRSSWAGLSRISSGGETEWDPKPEHV